MPAWESVIGATVGQFTDMGLSRTLMGIEPSYTPLPLASAYGAVLGALAVVLALLARERDGAGDAIEVPLAAALTEGLAYNSMHVADLPERYVSLREREIERRRADGIALDMSYAGVQRLLDPFYRTYRCADGRPFYLVCSSHRGHVLRTLDVLGIAAEVAGSGPPRSDPWLPSAEWPGGPGSSLFAYPMSQHWTGRPRGTGGGGARDAHQRRVGARVRGRGRACERAPHHGRLARERARAGVRADRGGGRPALRADAAPGRAGLARRRPGSGTGGGRGRPRPRRAGQAPAVARRRPDRRPHQRDRRPDRGRDARALRRGRGQGRPDQDAVRPRGSTVVYGFQGNQGKRSALVDVTSPGGADVLQRLLAGADVVTVNALERQLGPLGLGPDALAAAGGPVLCRLDAWGGAAARAALAGSGLRRPSCRRPRGSWRASGARSTRPRSTRTSARSTCSPGTAARSVSRSRCSGRARGHAVAGARVSLAAAGQLIQLPFMFDFPGRPPFDEPSGRTVKGSGPLHRSYRARDRWLFLACPPARVAALATVAGLDGVDALAGDALEAALTERLARADAADWAERCARVDVAAVPVATLREVRARSSVDAGSGPVDIERATFRFIRRTDHPYGHPVELVAPNAIRPRDAAIAIPGPAPKYGAHTRAVLAELGYAPDAIDRLVAERAVAEGWSAAYLPS